MPTQIMASDCQCRYAAATLPTARALAYLDACIINVQSFDFPRSDSLLIRFAKNADINL